MIPPAIGAEAGVARPMLHCILSRPVAPLSLPPAVRVLEAKGLAAVVSNPDAAALRTPDTADLTRFAELTVALHRDHTLIPMRYGCVLAGDEAVWRLLVLRQGRLAALLERLRDCGEMGVRVLLPPGGRGETEGPSPGRPDPTRPGHAHLAAVRRRLALETEATAQAERLDAELGRAVAGLYRESRQEFGRVAGRFLLSLYYLVPLGACPGFAEALKAHPYPVAPLTVSGPWPPYNFVGALDEDHGPLA